MSNYSTERTGYAEFESWHAAGKRRIRFAVTLGVLVAVAALLFFIGRSSVDTATPTPAKTPCGVTGAMCTVGDDEEAAPTSNPMDSSQRIAEQRRQAVAACKAEAAANNGGQPLSESQILACNTSQ
ncbi:hypothetical protein ACYSUO_23235 [Streptomyces sp. UC4497]